MLDDLSDRLCVLNNKKNRKAKLVTMLTIITSKGNW